MLSAKSDVGQRPEDAGASVEANDKAGSHSGDRTSGAIVRFIAADTFKRSVKAAEKMMSI
jgi:hypothetical protein